MKIGKRIAGIIVSAVFFVTALSLAASCGKEKKGIADVLDKTFVRFKDVSSVGIVNKKVSEKAEAEKRNYLVTFDENNAIEEVVFFKDETGEAGEITQEKIKAQIDQCYVADRFTFLRFSLYPLVAENRGDEYYTTNYLCNDYQQSFVVDNETGKVYSLESIGAVTSVSKCEVVINYSDHYYLSVKEGELQLKSVVNNPNIHVESVVKDIYGNTFVGVDNEDEIDGKIYYYNCFSQDDEIEYLFGNDGRMYVVKSPTPYLHNEKRVMYYDENLTLQNVEDNYAVTLYDLSHGTGNDALAGVLRKNKLFYGYSFYSRKEDGLFQEAVSLFWLGKLLAVDNYLFAVRENSTMLFLYDYDADFLSMERDIMNVKEVYKEGDHLIAVVETVSDTKRYKIWVENDEVKKELIARTAYEEVILSIQPLN